MIIKSREFLNDDGSVPDKLLHTCIVEHGRQKERLETLFNYYDGKHDITNRTMTDGLPNNKLVCNHAQYISDMATSYVFGVPVQYGGGEETQIKELNDHYTDIDEDSHNNELGLDMSIFGHALELIYMSNEESPRVMLSSYNPMNSFLVCDDTVEHEPMFAVTYSQKIDIDNQILGYNVIVITDKCQYKYFVKELSTENFVLKEEKEHYFKGVPVIEYRNNKFGKGDFEPVLTLIDAYNLLQSDRINDKEQLVDAILAVYGMSFGDNEEEMSKTAKFLKEHKILEIPDTGSRAEWLVKNLNETETEVLKKSIKDDIHEFSKVPCLTDENFVGNASGVAMKYKLLGLEQLGKTKERYFKQGLRKRLQLTSNILGIKARQLDVSKIDITMKRSLPVDDELLARIAQETDGFISWETRVQNYNPELDIDDEREKLLKEKQEAAKIQQEAFGTYGFDGGGDKVNEETE
jgi:SPP1 family phage portal protein